MGVRIGIRKGIKMKFGQASFHRENTLMPGKSRCGLELEPGSIRPARPEDRDRRCGRCFPADLLGAAAIKAMFE